MSSMIDFWGNIGATLGQGAANYSATKAAVEEQARQRKMQDDALRRQTALQDIEFAQAEGQALRTAGDTQGAYSALKRVLDARNRFDGGNRVGPQFIGTYTTKTEEAARPAPVQMQGPLMPNQARPQFEVQGPMPAGASVTTYDPNAIDWKNPQNSATLDAFLGSSTNKNDLVEVGGALYNIRTKQWEVSPTQLTGAQKQENIEDKIRQAYEIAKDKQEFALRLKEMGINAQTALAMLKIANRPEKAPPRERVELVTLDDGVYEYNKDTKQKTRVGDRPKSTKDDTKKSPFGGAPAATPGTGTNTGPIPIEPKGIHYGGISLVDKRHPVNQPKKKPAPAKPTAKSVGASIWGN